MRKATGGELDGVEHLASRATGQRYIERLTAGAWALGANVRLAVMR